MMNSEFETSLKIANSFESEIIGLPDEIAIFYATLFNPDITLKDRNKHALLFFQKQINDNNTKLMNSVLCETATIQDLHLSLIQAMLMMTEHIAAVQEHRQKVVRIFENRKQAYKQ